MSNNKDIKGYRNSLISVVVPVYNRENTIKDCINSILSQDYPEIELILVDDGSADSSGDICDKAAISDKRVKVIHQNNRGVSAARNSGIEKASGDFLMFVDSDDAMLPGMIKKMHDYSENNIDMVICGIEKRIKHKGTESHIYDDDNLENHIGKMDIAAIYEKGLLNSPCNKLYTLDLIRKRKIKFETWCYMGEDLIFNMQYLSLMTGDIIVINEALYIYNLENNWMNHLQRNPLSYDDTMRTHLKVAYYAGKINEECKDYFYEVALHAGIQCLKDYYKYNMIEDKQRKLIRIKEKIHDRKFKKLLIYLKKRGRINNLKFYLLYYELWRIYVNVASAKRILFRHIY